MSSDDDLLLPAPNANSDDDLSLQPVQLHRREEPIPSPQKKQRVANKELLKSRTKRKARNLNKSNPPLASPTVSDAHFGSAAADADNHFWDSLESNPIDSLSEELNEGMSHSAEAYDDYLDSVFAGAAGFFRLEYDLFVVQGYDTRKMMVKPSWHHLERMDLGLERHIVCFCPLAVQLPQVACVHARFLTEFGQAQFPDASTPNLGRHRQVIMFSWEKTETFAHYILSVGVQAGLVKGAKSRAIVAYHQIGEEKDGQWSCSKDGVSLCAHIQYAKRHLRLIEGNESLDDGSLLEHHNEELLASPPRGAQSISHLPIMPPSWVALPSDRDLYQRSGPFQNVPPFIPLGNDAKCVCGAIPDGDTPVLRRSCRIFTLLRSFECEVELKECTTKCLAGRTRYAGPDGRDLGLFNYNNQIFLSHDLLDDYTLQYTASETPFFAWVKTLATRYQIYGGSNMTFISEDTFRTAWFLYGALIEFSNDLCCSICGPEPSAVIFDGVTLAFGKKHLTSSLQPPTTLHPASPSRQSRYLSNQTILRDRTLRTQLRLVVTGPALHIGAGKSISRNDVVMDFQSDGSDDDDELSSNQSKATAAMVARLEAARIVAESLSKVQPELGQIFHQFCGLGRVSSSLKPPPQYLAFFREMAAEESVLQMIPYTSFADLKFFITNPTSQNATRLRSIPAIYGVLQFEEFNLAHTTQAPIYSASLLQALTWLHQRAIETFNNIVVHPEAPPQILALTQADWKMTGSLYGMPQIRLRPTYPKLKHDQTAEKGKQRAKCSKFYAQYGEQRLTGGISVAWCTHSIAYGFHCIPKAEGRNDVFSALVTHWKNPPKWVIYDYACALGPYCMTREPEFFKNTRFAIDDCHSNGHSKCGPASFLKTYAEADPRLGLLNTSAAECGNGGIGRIRKAVSYMRQDRAIIYTRVFISVWNRLKIRKLAQETH